MASKGVIFEVILFTSETLVEASAMSAVENLAFHALRPNVRRRGTTTTRAKRTKMALGDLPGLSHPTRLIPGTA